MEQEEEEEECYSSLHFHIFGSGMLWEVVKFYDKLVKSVEHSHY
jgi:hypothetical protein